MRCHTFEPLVGAGLVFGLTLGAGLALGDDAGEHEGDPAGELEAELGMFGLPSADDPFVVPIDCFDICMRVSHAIKPQSMWRAPDMYITAHDHGALTISCMDSLARNEVPWKITHEQSKHLHRETKNAIVGTCSSSREVFPVLPAGARGAAGASFEGDGRHCFRNQITYYSHIAAVTKHKRCRMPTMY